MFGWQEHQKKEMLHLIKLCLIPACKHQFSRVARISGRRSSQAHQEGWEAEHGRIRRGS